MPDANSHHPDMFTVTPTSLPRFWWLNPWLTAKRLHTACVALREKADAQAATIRQLREADSATVYYTYNPEADNELKSKLLASEADCDAQKDANYELRQQVETHKHNHIQTVKLLHQVIAERQALEAKLKKKKKGGRHG